ncbi:BrnA antitoxin family protein [Candidatus Uhrbacteria bacterium]|nr:BrnA antitoxin family protein [Candidatus Uhrbacteria bacterium]
MKKKFKKLPKFKTEAGERKFWSKHDSTDYIDWRQGQRVQLTNLRPSTATISLRLPEGMLAELKILARKRDVPYQSLIKLMLDTKIKEEAR